MIGLAELADHYGIASTSTDAFGKERTTSDETKRALLGAMGVEALSEEAVAEALSALEAEGWSLPLPPVLVVNSGHAVEVTITAPAHTGTITWRIAKEFGGEVTGQTRFADLPDHGSRLCDGIRKQKRLLTFSVELVDGYHTLSLDDFAADCTLIVTPGSCWLPPDDTRKLFGVAAQIYLLRSKDDWGIGGFAELRTLAQIFLQGGADVVGVNPLHAMFVDRPQDASPYSPSDRLLLNLLYISVEAIPEYQDCAEVQAAIASEDFQRKLRFCRQSPTVQYEEVAALKMPILRMLFSHFERNVTPERLGELAAFHEERRELLDRACTFQALREYIASKATASTDAEAMPAEYCSYTSSGVSRFRDEHAQGIRFHLWAQWIADAQLRIAAEACGGMKVGLYRDLAVGSAPAGAEVWSYPQTMVSKATVGAPPDIWNPAGQNWGLPPLDPHAARRHRYKSFIELIRSNMRYAGALRIDHALALQRLYWIPQDASPKDGAYVSYPMDDLLGILALESHRQHCMVIGEDLGTVPKGFRERVSRANVLSYRLLFFERDEDGFAHPDEYPRLSLSMASSHDLPTLRGWFHQADLQAKRRLGLFPSEESAHSAELQRGKDRIDLLQLLHRLGLLRSAEESQVSEEEFVQAAHGLLASSNSLMTLLQLDDLTNELEQVNIPGTTDENENWRRRLSRTMEELASGPHALPVLLRAYSAGS